MLIPDGRTAAAPPVRRPQVPPTPQLLAVAEEPLELLLGPHRGEEVTIADIQEARRLLLVSAHSFHVVLLS